jgi:SH3 domain-containing YSC84-like protein 1
MKKLLLLAMLAMIPSGLWAQGDRANTVERVQAAGTVIDEIMNAPDSRIPDEIFDSAKCIAVVPSMLKGAFMFGAQYGKGVASCRTEKGWSAPAFFRVTGGSFGFQIGGQAVDLIMVVMNDEGMQNLLASKFKIGADASAAAGPVGRQAAGSTDWKMRAQILTYSRARGIFAGISLDGAVVMQGKDDTRAFYGRMVPFKTLLTGELAAPEDAKPFISSLDKHILAASVKK